MRFVSLFAGVGGADLGLEAAGWECVAQVEWDKHCQQVLAYHWPDVPRWGDVATVNGGELPAADAIIFGSPCQDLSVAGKRAGLDGSRSNLFFEAVRIIREMRDATGGTGPRWAIWENVPGSLTSNKGADFGAVLDTLAEAGALVIEWAVLDAQHFGVPQRRRRVFVVACFDPVVAAGCPDPLLPVSESGCRDSVQTGQHIFFYRTHGVQDQCQVGVSPTLKTISPVCVASPGAAARALTPVEHERLMGWPDNHTLWRADGKQQADTNRYRQCGNGIVSPVAEWVANQINQAERATSGITT